MAGKAKGLPAPPDVGPIDASGIRTYPLSKRQSKFNREMLAKVHRKGDSVAEFLAKLPKVLAADELREVAAAVVKARQAGRPVVVGMGAHVIKVGLAPLLIDLIERNVITALAMNGACIIHDSEMAMVGHTSEDVDATLAGGGFGGAEETAATLNAAVASGPDEGLGRAVGEYLLARKFPYVAESLTATCARKRIPCTVHVALGTDIFHMHPKTDGATLGAASMRDFRILANVVRELKNGVYLNFGSAVIMPEVFLKAVSLSRNLGADLDGVTTANFDFIKSYRPLTNVVKRPTGGTGKGYSLVGHHEILIPLFVAAVVEGLES